MKWSWDLSLLHKCPFPCLWKLATWSKKLSWVTEAAELTVNSKWKVIWFNFRGAEMLSIFLYSLNETLNVFYHFYTASLWRLETKRLYTYIQTFEIQLYWEPKITHYMFLFIYFFCIMFDHIHSFSYLPFEGRSLGNLQVSLQTMASCNVNETMLHSSCTQVIPNLKPAATFRGVHFFNRKKYHHIPKCNSWALNVVCSQRMLTVPLNSLVLVLIPPKFLIREKQCH